jgi:hypothetical protein
MSSNQVSNEISIKDFIKEKLYKKIKRSWNVKDKCVIMRALIYKHKAVLSPYIRRSETFNSNGNRLWFITNPEKFIKTLNRYFEKNNKKKHSSNSSIRNIKLYIGCYLRGCDCNNCYWHKFTEPCKVKTKVKQMKRRNFDFEKFRKRFPIKPYENREESIEMYNELIEKV